MAPTRYLPRCLLEAEDHGRRADDNCPACNEMSSLPIPPALQSFYSYLSRLPPATHQRYQTRPKRRRVILRCSLTLNDQEFATDETHSVTEESVGDSELRTFDGEIENKDELHIPVPMDTCWP